MTDDSDITTEHRKEYGTQITTKTVTVEDATGAEYDHDFETDDVAGARSVDDYDYQGDGEPPESAVQALADHLNTAASGEEGA